VTQRLKPGIKEEKEMLVLRNGTYVSRINGHQVTLVYCGKDNAKFFIDGVYRGVCPFSYTKKKINKIEENPIYVYNLKDADSVLLRELKEPGKR
jgi:hypothetical protein